MGNKLRELIVRDLHITTEYMESFKNDKNPQVREMYIENKARKEALEDVLDYIKDGVTYQFRNNRW